MDAMYTVVEGVLRPIFRRGMRWTIEGTQYVPRSGPIILASNHTSYLDPICLGVVSAERDRRLRFLAKAELFERRGLGSFLRAMHQIPVARGTSRAADALDAGVAALGRGECVAVFPEGTISIDLDPMAGRTGVARLAAAAGVPVLPVGLWGAHRVMTKGRKPRWRTGVAEVAVVGAPVHVGGDEDMYEATDRVMRGICAALARAREIYPQQAGEHDDGWWVRRAESAVVRPSRDRDRASERDSERDRERDSDRDGSGETRSV